MVSLQNDFSDDFSKFQFSRGISHHEFGCHLSDLGKNYQSIRNNLTEFQQAVIDGDRVLVRRHINPFCLELEVNYIDGDELFEGLTALGLAALKRDIPMMRLLLAAGANIEGGFTSPASVAFAFWEEAPEPLSFLLEELEKRGLVPDFVKQY